MTSPCTMLPNVFCRGYRVFEGRVSACNFLHSSAGHNHSTCIEASKAKAKRVPVKKQNQHLGDNSRFIPTDANKPNRDSELSQSTLDSGRLPTDPLKKDEESISMEKAISLTSNETSLNTEREVVLRACVATCVGMCAAGVFIQQASHVLAEAGWSVPDSTLLLTFNVESWHLGLTMGLVVAVSVARQLLLQVWQDFSESNNVANRRVLGPLRLGDYFIVTVLPGISEELLFRGALLPCFGLDWKGVTISGIIFGVLHLSGGRKIAFSVWASFVGILYGLAFVSTQNVIVPMAAHSINNLVGATLWKLNQGDAD